MRHSKAGTLEGLDGSARYSDGRGVALRIAGWVKRWEPTLCLGLDEETGKECEIESGEGEWVDDVESGRVIVVMVGDDSEAEIDFSDLTKIDDDDYCGGCGQIGCTHDGRERSNAIA